MGITIITMIKILYHYTIVEVRGFKVNNYRYIAKPDER